jgi:hypothetical protein
MRNKIKGEFMPEMTDEQIDQHNAGLRKAMAYELLEMCQIVEPSTIFGADTFKNPGDFNEIFQFIDAMRNTLDDDKFMAFYQGATIKGKKFYSRGLATEPGSAERAEQVDIIKACEKAFAKLTPKDIKALQKLNFNKINEELEAKLNDGSLVCDTDDIVGFFRQAIKQYSK